MSKLAGFLILFSLALAVAAPRLRAENAAAYAVMDAASGHIFDAANPDKKLQVGSLTKIATGIVVLDWADVGKQDLGQLATIPNSAAAMEGVNPVGLQPGDRATLRDLLYAALMQSDNIAAQALAEHVGKTLPGDAKTSASDRFVAQMNALARQLRMERTLFLNAHGLENERKLPYSTAADMARLAQHAMNRSAFRFFVSQPERRITILHPGGEQSGYLLRNTNELVGTDGIDGVKTGKTRRAGECVIVSAALAPQSVRDGDGYVVTQRRLIVVVLGSTNRFNVAHDLLARGWQMHEQWVAAGRPEKRR
jgi:serine-type D-Ala-D-Ala carboxypeptidase (penicillin-binding protein 5/6)